MPEISLAVTKRALEYATKERERERQIAYTLATPDISPRLAEVGTKHRLKLRFGGIITLIVADRGAIWRAHNEEHLEDFDSLYALLSQYPSKPMRFLCEIAE